MFYNLENRAVNKEVEQKMSARDENVQIDE